MSHSVSVRDTKILEHALGNGLNFKIPNECIHNSKVIETLLQLYAPKVHPSYSLTPQETQRMADGVAYLLRPDMIINGRIDLFPESIKERRDSYHSTANYNGTIIHLKNNPELLVPGFELKREDSTEEQIAIGAEFFRCYNGVFASIPHKLQDKAGCFADTFRLTFPLADMTSFLLCPSDLTDYEYSEEELSWFKDEVTREIESQ